MIMQGMDNRFNMAINGTRMIQLGLAQVSRDVKDTRV